MRAILLAIAPLALAACANPNNRDPNAPNVPPYAPAVQTTSGNVPATGEEPTVGGAGYGGTTEFGLTNGPQGEPYRGNQDPRGRNSNVEPPQTGHQGGGTAH